MNDCIITNSLAAHGTLGAVQCEYSGVQWALDRRLHTRQHVPR